MMEMKEQISRGKMEQISRGKMEQISRGKMEQIVLLILLYAYLLVSVLTWFVNPFVSQFCLSAGDDWALAALGTLVLLCVPCELTAVWTDRRLIQWLNIHVLLLIECTAVLIVLRKVDARLWYAELLYVFLAVLAVTLVLSGRVWRLFECRKRIFILLISCMIAALFLGVYFLLSVREVGWYIPAALLAAKVCFDIRSIFTKVKKPTRYYVISNMSRLLNVSILMKFYK